MKSYPRYIILKFDSCCCVCNHELMKGYPAFYNLKKTVCESCAPPKWKEEGSHYRKQKKSVREIAAENARVLPQRAMQFVWNSTRTKKKIAAENLKSMSSNLPTEPILGSTKYDKIYAKAVELGLTPRFVECSQIGFTCIGCGQVFPERTPYYFLPHSLIREKTNQSWCCDCNTFEK
jgi:hypothetical protein